VLNALRHQRLGNLRLTISNQLKFSLIGAQRLAASTVGKPAVVPGGVIIRQVVLNALRHQRLGNNPTFNLTCVGNFVLNALRHQRLGNRSAWGIALGDFGAQRLAASTVGKRGDWSKSLRLGARAQRLAASTVGKPI